MACGLGSAFVDLTDRGVALRDAAQSVEGARNGPVSREQPAAAQPVAAGPVKVGAFWPRLDVVTAVVRVLAAPATRAAAGPEMASSATGKDSTESTTAVLRRRLFFLIGCNVPPQWSYTPQGIARLSANSPAPWGDRTGGFLAVRGGPDPRRHGVSYIPVGATFSQGSPAASPLPAGETRAAYAKGHEVPLPY